MEKWKVLLSVIGGAIAVFSRQYAIIIIFVSVAVVMDIITGIVKCKATGEEITSKKGAKGFWKKIALFVALFFGFFLDYFIPYAVGTIGLKLPESTAIFGCIVGCYIVLNELISIAENLFEANPEIMPKWIVSLLNLAKKQIDDRTKEEEKDGSDS